MAVTESFRNAVSTESIKRIHIMMKDSLLVDPTFTELNEMEQVAQNITGLYDVHDGRVLEMDKAYWCDDYMNQMMVQLMTNFSRERLKHLKAIIGYLRPVETDTEKIKSNSDDCIKDGKNHQPSNDCCQRSRAISRHTSRMNSGVKKRKGSGTIVKGAAIGGLCGVVIATIAECALLSSVAIVVVGATIGGGVAVATKNVR